MKLDALDIFLLIVMMAIIIASFVFAFEYYRLNYRECTAKPLRYGAKTIDDLYNTKFYGHGQFNQNEETYFVKFNSTDFIITQK